MKTIVYQGIQGAFSYLTAVKEFGEECHYKGFNSFREVFEELMKGGADYAVIPIENSLIGSIYENYDHLHRYPLQIIGEHLTRIEHCLMASHGEKEALKKVLSHPKALEQCSSFFWKHPGIEAVVYVDTAAAALEVALKGDLSYGAIASKSAGKLYGLQVIEESIGDDPLNYTRFVIVAKDKIPNARANKCSLVIQLKHVPGALAEVLNLFASRGMNLTKIESRPLKESPFEYLFYLDFLFKNEMEETLLLLGEKVQTLKILGFYEQVECIA